MKRAVRRAREAGILVIAAAAVAGVMVFACGSDDGDGMGRTGTARDGGFSADDDSSAACTAAPTIACEPDASATCPCGFTCYLNKCEVPVACNEALIAWEAPLTNLDGTCLRELGGFVVYGGVDASGGPYPNVFDAGKNCFQSGTGTCGDAEAVPLLTCSYRARNLTNGVWYFIATAYNATGIESPATPEVSKVVQCP
jgi:hypothetical protein